MPKGIVLSIDDDADLQTVLEDYLVEDGYKVIKADSVSSALEKAQLSQFDVILLDLILPDGEGLSLLTQLRGHSSAPIIVVSGKNDTTEKIVCLEMGADDYMTKPFELRELAARIKAVLRRSNDNSGAGNEKNTEVKEKIFFDGWCLDRTQYQLFDPEKNSADLTTGEFKLLEALLLSPNRALSRDHLFDLTRSQDYASYDRAIDIQIARVRKKLKDNAKLIKTVRGVGYMFVGQIEKN